MFGEIDEKSPQKDPQFEDLNANLPPEPEFFGLDSQKSSDDESQTEPTIDSSASGIAAEQEDDEIQGVELKEYAKRESITVDQLWRKIRAGQLIARTENGFVYVYGSNQPQAMKMENTSDKANNLDTMLARENLPPLPSTLDDEDYYGNLPAVQNQSKSVAEVALLLDHLTVAKEESKQVLRLSQESIARITQMSEAIVKAKDELIAQKEKVLESTEQSLSAQQEEIAELRKQIASREEENRKLRQEVEDLEMLTRTLGGEV